MKDSSLFAELSRGDQNKLAKLGVVKDYSAGACIFRQASSSESLWVVVDGRVALKVQYKGAPERTVLTLQSDELLGWSALIGQSRVASAHAVVDTRLLEFSGHALRQLCEDDHDIGYLIMRQAFFAVARRLRDTRLQLLDFYQPTS